MKKLETKPIKHTSLIMYGEDKNLILDKQCCKNSPTKYRFNLHNYGITIKKIKQCRKHKIRRKRIQMKGKIIQLE